MTTTRHRMTVHSVGALDAGRGDGLTNFVMLTGGKSEVKEIAEAFGDEVEIVCRTAKAPDHGDGQITHDAMAGVLLRTTRVIRIDLRSAIEIGCLAQNGEAEVSAMAPPAPHSLGVGMCDHVFDQLVALRQALLLFRSLDVAHPHDGQPEWLDRVIDGTLDIFPRKRSAP